MYSFKQIFRTFYYPAKAAQNDFANMEPGKFLIRELRKLDTQVSLIKTYTVPIGKIFIKMFYVLVIVFICSFIFGFNSHKLTAGLFITQSLLAVYIGNFMPITVATAYKLGELINETYNNASGYFGKENLSAVTVSEYVKRAKEEQDKRNQASIDLVNSIMGQIKSIARSNGVDVSFLGDVPEGDNDKEDDTENGKNNPM